MSESDDTRQGGDSKSAMSDDLHHLEDKLRRELNQKRSSFDSWAPYVAALMGATATVASSYIERAQARAPITIQVSDQTRNEQHFRVKKLDPEPIEFVTDVDVTRTKINSILSNIYFDPNAGNDILKAQRQALSELYALRQNYELQDSIRQKLYSKERKHLESIALINSVITSLESILNSEPRQKT